MPIPNLVFLVIFIINIRAEPYIGITPGEISVFAFLPDASPVFFVIVISGIYIIKATATIVKTESRMYLFRQMCREGVPISSAAVGAMLRLSPSRHAGPFLYRTERSRHERRWPDSSPAQRVPASLRQPEPHGSGGLPRGHDGSRRVRLWVRHDGASSSASWCVLRPVPVSRRTPGSFSVLRVFLGRPSGDGEQSTDGEIVAVVAFRSVSERRYRGVREASTSRNHADTQPSRPQERQLHKPAERLEETTARRSYYKLRR